MSIDMSIDQNIFSAFYAIFSQALIKTLKSNSSIQSKSVEKTFIVVA